MKNGFTWHLQVSVDRTERINVRSTGWLPDLHGYFYTISPCVQFVCDSWHWAPHKCLYFCYFSKQIHLFMYL